MNAAKGEGSRALRTVWMLTRRRTIVWFVLKIPEGIRHFIIFLWTTSPSFRHRESIEKIYHHALAIASHSTLSRKRKKNCTVCRCDCRLSTKLTPAFGDRGCHAVSATDPYGRIIWFLGQKLCHDQSKLITSSAAVIDHSKGTVCSYKT
jgi:hypothetical protein